ncbi:dihydroxy-acid dehydratase [Penicillium antarcticum]|uniref:dihydroxy-acid dehydratase n=1 Tax=Penicillium antarcticum TaxID=416450 RepID=UPI002394813F|nr:dihydroxy-acid dehydratase [Penicillium antarcticum]KAJ5295251.1 dihydroxy-acid dehydratase [Penicillium antarcticum]
MSTNKLEGFKPYHANVPQLIEAAERSVQLSGSLAVDFPRIGIRELFSSSTITDPAEKGELVVGAI